MGAHLASPYLPASPGPPRTFHRDAGFAVRAGRPVRQEWDFVASSAAAGATAPRLAAALVTAAACAGRARRVARAAGRMSYEKLYKPLSPESDLRKGPQTVSERATGWRKENTKLREDESWSKQVVWDPNPRGRKGRRYAKSTVVDVTEERERQAAELRALQKRPRFGWKEVMQDDVRTSRLSEDLPAIGSGEVWLSKFLAHTGVCSRRKVTQLVLQGRVMVNDEVVQEVAMKVNPRTDKVAVDGQKKTLKTLGEIIWIMLNKPKGVISTFKDSEGRKTVMDCVPFSRQRRLVPVGRIDRNAAGLMLLTNDYEWHTIMAHPRYEHSKRYKVQVYNGLPSRTKMQALEAGLELPDEPLPLLPLTDFDYGLPDKVQEIATLKFTMKQGRYRQIRRMFEYIGHPVRSIKRIEFGLLKLDRKLKPGDWRVLSPKEIRQLKGPTILKRPRKHPVIEEQMLEQQVQEIERNEAREARQRRREEQQRWDPSTAKWGDPRAAEWEDHWEDQEEMGQQGYLPQYQEEYQEEEQWGGQRGGQWGDQQGYAGEWAGQWDGQRNGHSSQRQSGPAPERRSGRAPRPRGERRWKSKPVLGGSGVRSNLGRGPPEELWGGPRTSEEPREATAEDLARLQQRFDSLAAVSAPEPQGLENDWEKNWVQQLDAMQAEQKRA